MKQNSDQAENLRQALKSFRDAIDALFYPLPSALENIVLAERLIEDFNVSQPLVGFTPFDALKSEANIDIANNATKDKTPKRYRNTDLERHQSTKSRGKITEANTTQTMKVKQDREIDQLRVNTSKNDSSGNIVAMNDAAPSTSRVQQFAVRDTTSETSAKHINKQIRQNLGFSELNTTTPILALPIEPLPASVDPNQIPAQDSDAVENTLVVVDNLVQQILDDEHQTYAKQKKVDSSLNRRSLDKRADKRLQKESILSTNSPFLGIKPLPAVPQGETFSHTEQGNHPRRKNKQANSYYSGAEGTRDKELHFNSSNSYQAISNSLTKIGIIADEILQSPITGHGANIKVQNISNESKNDRAASDNSGLSASHFNTIHNMKFQQTKGDFLLNKLSNATNTVLDYSMSANSIDKDAITRLVNEVLVEQAKRHGVDLS
ncbi:MAG: hypothetical protein U9N47_01720 [Thermodesulfobacteriota bacterium]|nr:hypothetical protein [Thermodesulfobacteriota bacterium]